MCIQQTIFFLLTLFIFIERIDSKPFVQHEECEKFYLSNDCYYFPCLDVHYPCGRSSHLVKFSYNVCQLTSTKYYEQFNENAQLYFNRTNQCAMNTLHDQLIQPKITSVFSCAQLQLVIFKSYLTCFQNKQRENKLVTVIDFCSIICDNLEAMINLFLNLNDGSANLVELLSETGKDCGASISPMATRTIPSLLIAICLDRKNVRLKDDITKLMFNPRFEFNDYDWG